MASKERLGILNTGSLRSLYNCIENAGPLDSNPLMLLAARTISKFGKRNLQGVSDLYSRENAFRQWMHLNYEADFSGANGAKRQIMQAQVPALYYLFVRGGVDSLYLDRDGKNARRVNKE